MDDLLEYFESLLVYAHKKNASLNPDSKRALGQLISQFQEVIESHVDRQQAPSQTQPSETPEAPAQGAPPADAQLLWYLAGQKEDAFLQYLQNYPSPATQNLLRNPEELERVIRYLHAEAPSGRPQQIGDIQQTDINSSNVWGTAYDPRTNKMKVRFHNGSEYEYDGVPINIYRAVISGNAAAKTLGQNQYGRWWPTKSPSIGAALNQYVKAAGFPYRQIK